jgi:hypothetical protein
MKGNVGWHPNTTTFHRVRDFRSLALDLEPRFDNLAEVEQPGQAVAMGGLQHGLPSQGS